MSKILVDTNILIYALDESSEFFGGASALLQNEENVLYITTKNISEFFAVCSKLKIQFDTVFGFYKELIENVTVLKPTNQSLEKFEMLLQKYKPKGNLVYDIEIVSVMLDNGVSTLATVNYGDFCGISEIETLKIK